MPRNQNAQGVDQEVDQYAEDGEGLEAAAEVYQGGEEALATEVEEVPGEEPQEEVGSVLEGVEVEVGIPILQDPVAFEGDHNLQVWSCGVWDVYMVTYPKVACYCPSETSCRSSYRSRNFNPP